MKRILITGANSYIGTSVEKYLLQWPDEYSVRTVDMIDNVWRGMDFSAYDCVYHVAGIAHVRESKEILDLFYQVNRDMAVEAAIKAKHEGVKQFIFMSSMSVYGTVTGVITRETKPNPKNHYGKSKLQAEEQITAIADSSFMVAILRPPMVYGEGCKGNYQMLCKLAKKLPFFPNVRNKRSMIHIDKLCEFIKGYIDTQANGLFFPQDDDYVCTSQMVAGVAAESDHNIRLTKLFNWAIYLMRKCGVRIVNKIFGDLIYERE